MRISRAALSAGARLDRSSFHVLETPTLAGYPANEESHLVLSPNVGGALTVRWEVAAGDDGLPWLRLEWNELRREHMAPPTRSGLGTELIRNLTTFELGGRTDLQFEAHGVRCVLETPLAV